jgi:multiple sugar transport system substrate-binding protein
MLAGLGAMAGAGALAACAGATPAPAGEAGSAPAAATQPPAAAATPVEEIVGRAAPAGVAKVIKLSVWGDITDMQIYSGIADDFHKQQGDIGVELEQWIGSYYEKMQTQIAGGVEPDLIYVQGWRWQPFAERNVIRPFNEFIDADLPDYMTDVWSDAARSQTDMDGKTFMAVSDGGAMVMICAQEPFVEIVQKLTGTFDGVEQWGYQAQGGYERLAPFIRLNGALEWDQIVNPRKANFDDPAVTKEIQLWVGDFVNEMKASPSPAMMQGGANQIQTGNVAIKYEGPWFLARMWGASAAREGGTKFEALPVPRGSAGTICNGFRHGHAMSARAKDPAACWELIKFIGSDVGQEHVSKGGRQPNSARRISEMWGPIVEDMYNFTTSSAFATGWDTGTVHVISGAELSMTNEAIVPALDSVINGRRTAEEAFAEANQDIQAILDDYWAEKEG